MRNRLWPILVILCFVVFVCFHLPTNVYRPLVAGTHFFSLLFGKPECAVSSSNHKRSETRQVVFAKVHKAASSTVQNILLRFALARDLSALLPSKLSAISQSKAEIRRSKVVPQPEGNRLFDILCNHIIYDGREIAKYFSHRAVRVAILREPMAQALSALQYYTTLYPTPKLTSALHKYPHDPVNGFLNHPEDFSSEDMRQDAETSFLNNRMSIDLGVDLLNFQASKSNKSKIKEFLRTVEDEFDLVLISDYFDESMVLLRRYLSWSMKDVIYLKVNTAQSNRADSVWSREPRLNSSTYSTFRQWNIFDYELYEHFLPLFLQAIKSERLFENEVRAYKTVLKDVAAFCDDTAAQAPLRMPEGDWNEAFTVSRYDCELMSQHEEDLVEMTRERQLERWKQFRRDKLNDAMSI